MEGGFGGEAVSGLSNGRGLLVWGIGLGGLRCKGLVRSGGVGYARGHAITFGKASIASKLS